MKVKVNFTIEETVKNDFNSYCKENHINKSSLVEEFIITWLKERKENDKK